MRAGEEWTQVDEGSKGAGLEKQRHGQKAQCGAKYLPSCHEAPPVLQGTPPRGIISKSKSLRPGRPLGSNTQSFPDSNAPSKYAGRNPRGVPLSQEGSLCQQSQPWRG